MTRRRIERCCRVGAWLLLLSAATVAHGQFFQVTDEEEFEGNTGTVNMVFTVSFVNIPQGEGCGLIDFDYMTIPGSADADVDYTTTTGTDTLDSCDSSSTFEVTVPLIGDIVDEGFSESFTLRVADQTGQFVDGNGQILDDDLTTVSIADAAVAEGDSGTTAMDFVVTLSTPRDNPTGVGYVTADGTASGVTDYVPDSNSILIPALETEGVITITVNGDTLFETDETFLVNIATSDNVPPVDDPQAVGTILNDDPQDSITIGDVAVAEGDAGVVDAVFNVSLSAPRQDTVLVDFTTANGTADRGADYRLTTGQIAFPPGTTAATITVEVLGDTEAEADESFFVDLTLVNDPVEGGTGGPPIIADGRGTATILDDDLAGTVSVADLAVDEGDSGVLDAMVVVALSEPLPETVFVDFATANGTASADGDYRGTSGRIAIGAGTTSGVIAIPIEGDTVVEGDETFFVDLTATSGPPIADDRAVVTIRDDDAGGVRLAAVEAAGEGAGTAEVTVERLGGGGAAQVQVNVTSGTATAGLDFVALSETVSWGAGEVGPRTLAVQLLDDNLVEGDETAIVSISQPTGASIVGSPTDELTITDDDEAIDVVIVGEAESTGTVEGVTELTVRVTDGAGVPIAGARIDWSADGAVEVLGDSTTFTDEQGISEQTVEHDQVPGIATVLATLFATGEVIRFDLTIEGDLRELFPESAPGTNEVSVANVLDSACVTATGQFGAFCSYLFTLPGPGDQRSVLGQITPEETPAQGAMSLESTQIQLRNLAARLAALREGRRQAIDQLAFTIRGEPVPWQAIVAAMAPVDEIELPEFADLVVGADDAAQEAPPETPVDVDADDLPRWGFFLNGRVAMGDRDGTSSEEGFDVDAAGLTAGVDYRVNDRLVWGAALGYLDTDVELVNDGGGLDAQGTSLAVYGTYFRDTYYFDWTAAYGVNDFDVSRNVDLPLPFQGQSRWTASGSPDSSQLSLAVSGGWDRAAGATNLGLFGRFSYVDADIDGYREGGGGPFNLALGDQEVTSLLGEGGLEVSRAWSRNWGVWQPHFRVSYLHEFEDDSRLIRGSFLGDPSATEFVIATDAPDRDFFNLGAGMTFVFSGGRSFYLFYDTDLERDDLEIFTLSLGLRWEF